MSQEIKLAPRGSYAKVLFYLLQEQPGEVGGCGLSPESKRASTACGSLESLPQQADSPLPVRQKLRATSQAATITISNTKMFCHILITRLF